MTDESYKVVEINPYSFWLIFITGMAWIGKQLYYGWDIQIGFNPFQIIIAGLILFSVVAIGLSFYISRYQLNKEGITKEFIFRGILAFPRPKTYKWEDFYLIFLSNEIDAINLFARISTFYIANKPNFKCNKLTFADDEYEAFIQAVKKFTKGVTPKNRPEFRDLIFNKYVMGIMGIIAYLGIVLLYFTFKNGVPEARVAIFSSLPFLGSLLYWITFIIRLRR